MVEISQPFCQNAVDAKPRQFESALIDRSPASLPSPILGAVDQPPGKQQQLIGMHSRSDRSQGGEWRGLYNAGWIEGHCGRKEDWLARVIEGLGHTIPQVRKGWCGNARAGIRIAAMIVSRGRFRLEPGGCW